MKLLHTSDWHLGMTLRGGISYRDDQYYSIKHIYEIAREEKIDAILISGDIFDRSVASAEAIQMYDDIVTHICVDMNIPVFIIAGNHDGADRLSQCSRLLEKSGLYIAGALTDEPYVVNMGDVDIYMLPWISTEKVKATYPDEDMPKDMTMEEAYDFVLDKYRDKFINGHKNILMAHAFIVNATTSVSDRAAEIGSATMVASKVFEGFDYVALGHLHGPQQINEKIRYSGTPMAYSFGKEETQEKSVTVIDTDTMSQKIIPLRQLHKRITLKGAYDELMRADFDEDTLKGYVRLEVTDSFVGMESIALFRERYSNLLEITGKSFDKSDEKITMTIEEFENAENNPKDIFYRYCEDILEESPSEHMLSLFENALGKYEKEVTRK